MSRMTDPANSLCFPKKMRVVPTPQTPCVFSGKIRLAFNVTVNLKGDAADRSRKTCVAATLPDSLCFLMWNASWVQCECKFKCDAADRKFLVFSKESTPRRNPAAFFGFTFLVFCHVKWVLGSQVSSLFFVLWPLYTGRRTYAKLTQAFAEWKVAYVLFGVAYAGGYARVWRSQP